MSKTEAPVESGQHGPRPRSNKQIALIVAGIVVGLAVIGTVGGIVWFSALGSTIDSTIPGTQASQPAAQAPAPQPVVTDEPTVPEAPASAPAVANPAPATDPDAIVQAHLAAFDAATGWAPTTADTRNIDVAAEFGGKWTKIQTRSDVNMLWGMVENPDSDLGQYLASHRLFSSAPSTPLTAEQQVGTGPVRTIQMMVPMRTEVPVTVRLESVHGHFLAKYLIDENGVTHEDSPPVG